MLQSTKHKISELPRLRNCPALPYCPFFDPRASYYLRLIVTKVFKMVLDKRSLWVVLATCISMCIARPSGPDISSSTNRDNVCNAMRPNPTTSPHGNGTAGDGDYRLEINPPMTEATDGFNYTADTAYTSR